jgi:hypothetical protein
MNKFYRHGDISFHPLKTSDIPTNAKRADHTCYVVAYGEATGHHHELCFKQEHGALMGDVPADTNVSAPRVTIHICDDGRRFAELNYVTGLDHPEHGLLTLEKGVYEIIQERTFDYFENSIKKVID